MSEIMPCPMCGSEAKASDGLFVRVWCSEFDCRMSGPREPDIDTAVTRWNQLCSDIQGGRIARHTRTDGTSTDALLALDRLTAAVNAIHDDRTDAIHACADNSHERMTVAMEKVRHGQALATRYHCELRAAIVALDREDVDG